MDLTAVCRTCLGGDSLRPIFKSILDNENYSKAILMVTGVKVQHYDNLPQNMCMSCSTKLSDIFKFRIQCKDAEIKIINSIKDNKTILIEKCTNNMADNRNGSNKNFRNATIKTEINGNNFRNAMSYRLRLMTSTVCTVYNHAHDYSTSRLTICNRNESYLKSPKDSTLPEIVPTPVLKAFSSPDILQHLCLAELCSPCCSGGCPNLCNFLPPPCNTPPKCIQNMTGYYYYPYGFWFCGPYHCKDKCVPIGNSCPTCCCGQCTCAACCPQCVCSSCSPCRPCFGWGPCCPVGGKEKSKKDDSIFNFSKIYSTFVKSCNLNLTNQLHYKNKTPSESKSIVSSIPCSICGARRTYSVPSTPCKGCGVCPGYGYCEGCNCRKCKLRRWIHCCNCLGQCGCYGQYHYLYPTGGPCSYSGTYGAAYCGPKCSSWYASSGTCLGRKDMSSKPPKKFFHTYCGPFSGTCFGPWYGPRGGPY